MAWVIDSLVDRCIQGFVSFGHPCSVRFPRSLGVGVTTSVKTTDKIRVCAGAGVRGDSLPLIVHHSITGALDYCESRKQAIKSRQWAYADAKLTPTCTV